jgi:transposase-like protein
MAEASNHEGEVLDMLVQSRRDSRAALRLMRKLLRKQGFVPKLLVTDKLRSYGSAFRQLQLTCPHVVAGAEGVTDVTEADGEALDALLDGNNSRMGVIYTPAPREEEWLQIRAEESPSLL